MNNVNYDWLKILLYRRGNVFVEAAARLPPSERVVGRARSYITIHQWTVADAVALSKTASASTSGVLHDHLLADWLGVTHPRADLTGEGLAPFADPRDQSRYATS